MLSPYEVARLCADDIDSVSFLTFLNAQLLGLLAVPSAWDVCGGALIVTFSPVALEAFHRVRVNSFKKHHQIHSLYLNGLVLAIDESHIRKAKLADFQLLGEDGKAILIPPEDLNEVALPVPEQKQAPSKRVLMNEIFDQTKQSGKGPAHVGRLGADKDAQRRCKIEHHSTPKSEITDASSVIEHSSDKRRTTPLRRTTSMAVSLVLFWTSLAQAAGGCTIRTGAKSPCPLCRPPFATAASVSASLFRQFEKLLY